jgi:hypothetical protein
MPCDNLGKAAAPLERPGRARGILKVRHNIDKLDPIAAFQPPFERLQIHPFIIGRHFHPARCEHLESRDGSNVSRALADYGVSLVEKQLASQVQCLLGAGCDQHFLDRCVHAPSSCHTGNELFTERQVSLCGRVLKCLGPFFLKDPVRRFFQFPDGQQFRRRQAAGE